MNIFWANFDLSSSRLYFLLLTSGLSVGSFLNVVIDRLPNGKNLLGRSVSDCCGRTLGLFDLLPVVSFILSRGKCLHCGKKISVYYPLVEIISALATVVVFLYLPLPYPIFYIINIYFLIVFFFTDLKYGLVPTVVFLFNLIFVLSFNIYFLLNGQLSTFNFQLSIITALASALFFIFLILITRGRGMGFGDVLLAFLFSLMLGFPGSVLMIWLSFIFGGLVSSILLIVRKKHFGQTVPFGPFMVMATLVCLFYGKDLLNWYLAKGI